MQQFNFVYPYFLFRQAYDQPIELPTPMAYGLNMRVTPGFKPFEDVLRSPECMKQELRPTTTFHGDQSLYDDELHRLFEQREEDGSPMKSQIGRDLKDAVSPNSTYQLFKSPDQKQYSSVSPIQQPTVVEDLIPNSRYGAISSNGGQFQEAGPRRIDHAQFYSRPFGLQEEATSLPIPMQQPRTRNPQKLMATISPRVAAAAQTASVLFPPVSLSTSMNNNYLVASTLPSYGEVISHPQYSNGLNIPMQPSGLTSSNFGLPRAGPADFQQLPGMTHSTYETQRRRLRMSSSGSPTSCTSDEMTDDFMVNGIDSPELDAIDIKQLIRKLQVLFA